MSEQKYLPALGYAWLTPLYDPVVRLTTRESVFKNALVAQASLCSGDFVLDLGCGTGTLAIMLGEAEADLNIFGIDGDSKILGLARNKAERVSNQIGFVQGMSFQLPYGSDSFDHVFSSLFFHHLSREDKLRTLEEVRRVLKPNGVLHVADWGRPDNFAMKLGSYLVMALDGTKTTRDNFEGNLPQLIETVGFKDIVETTALNTVFGTLRILMSTKKQTPVSRV